MSSEQFGSSASNGPANLKSLPRATAGRLSPFGKKLRKLRFEHSKRIYDLAQDLEVSSSSVSAWETGRREVGEAEIEKIGTIFSLNEAEVTALREAAELSKNRVVIEPCSSERQQLAIRMKQRINELTSDEIQSIMDHLKWSRSDRARWDCIVSKKSVTEIERVAQIVRRIARAPGSHAFDIVAFFDGKLDSTFFHFLETEDIENTAFEIWDDAEMPKDTRGMTMMFPPHIVLSNSVYEGAANGGSGDKWIMAHELGHLLLLHGFESQSVHARGPEYIRSTVTKQDADIPFRAPKGTKKIPRDQSAETQADDFAAELLMPRQYCKGMLWHNISRRYEVSRSLAEKRLQFVAQTTTLH